MKQTKMVAVSLDNQTIVRLQNFSGKNGLLRSATIRFIVCQFLEGNQNENS